MTDEAEAGLVGLLARAHEGGGLVAPVEVGGLEEGYRVQELLRGALLESGAVRRGWKVGLTSAGSQRDSGVDHPVAGFLLAHLVSTDVADVNGSPRPRVEVEVAFELGADLPGDATAEQVRAATAGLRVALEVVDSRWEGGPGNVGMLVADNVNHVGVVLGPTIDPGTDLTALRVSLSCAGQTSTGGSAEVFGDPALTVAWLAAELHRRGHTLRAGDLVMSGTLCPPLYVRPGDSFTAEVEGLAQIVVSSWP